MLGLPPFKDYLEQGFEASCYCNMFIICFLCFLMFWLGGCYYCLVFVTCFLFVCLLFVCRLLLLLLLMMLLPCIKASDLSACSSDCTLYFSAFVRPHLQQESTEAEERRPTVSARSRCADGGDELFGSFVGIEIERI